MRTIDELKRLVPASDLGKIIIIIVNAANGAAVLKEAKDRGIDITEEEANEIYRQVKEMKIDTTKLGGQGGTIIPVPAAPHCH